MRTQMLKPRSSSLQSKTTQKKHYGLTLVITENMNDIGDIISSDSSHNSIEDDNEIFKELANDLMEEYPVESSDENSDEPIEYESMDEDTPPTFTYLKKQGENTYDEQINQTNQTDKWYYIIDGITKNNTKIIDLISKLGIVPDVNTINSFYVDNQTMNHTDKTKAKAKRKWKLIDALNTLLGESQVHPTDNETFEFAVNCLSSDLITKIQST